MESKYLIRVLVIFLTVVSCAPLPPPDKRLAEAEARIKALEAEISRAEADYHKAKQSLDEAKRNLEVQLAETQRLRQALQEREEAIRAMRSDLNRAEELRNEAREAQRNIASLEKKVASAKKRLSRQNEELTKAQNDYLNDVKELKNDIAEEKATAMALKSSIAEAKVTEYRDGSEASSELRNTYRKASTNFVYPETMMVGDIKEVRLHVSLKESVEELREKLEEQAKAAGYQILANEIKVYNALRASLTGSKGLVVRPLNETDQSLKGSSQKSKKWIWEVEAVEDGEKKLYLTLTALPDKGGKDAVEVIDTWVEVVKVDVSPKRALYNFWKKNWQWIWSALIVPIAVFLWEMGKSRGRRGFAAKETPKARLNIESPTAHIQLNMRSSYTPTSTDDANGAIGDIAWDENYVYVKTSSGWKRLPLGIF